MEVNERVVSIFQSGLVFLHPRERENQCLGTTDILSEWCCGAVRQSLGVIISQQKKMCEWLI